jgi:hypothetical protein
MRSDSSDLVVIDPLPAKGINLVTQTPPTVKVKVRAPFRIVVGGVAHTGGDVLEVPDDDNTRLWVRAGWVERVPDEPKAAPKRSKRSARPG